MQKELDLGTMLNELMSADPFVLYDCCGFSDGAARAIVATPEIGRALGKTHLVTIKALRLSLSAGRKVDTAEPGGSYVRNTRDAAKRTYGEASVLTARE